VPDFQKQTNDKLSRRKRRGFSFPLSIILDDLLSVRMIIRKMSKSTLLLLLGCFSILSTADVANGDPLDLYLTVKANYEELQEDPMNVQSLELDHNFPNSEYAGTSLCSNSGPPVGSNPAVSTCQFKLGIPNSVSIGKLSSVKIEAPSCFAIKDGNKVVVDLVMCVTNCEDYYVDGNPPLQPFYTVDDTPTRMSSVQQLSQSLNDGPVCGPADDGNVCKMFYRLDLLHVPSDLCVAASGFNDVWDMSAFSLKNDDAEAEIEGYVRVQVFKSVSQLDKDGSDEKKPPSQIEAASSEGEDGKSPLLNSSTSSAFTSFVSFLATALVAVLA